MLSEACQSVVPKRDGVDPSWFNRWFAQIVAGAALLVSFIWTSASFPHVELCYFRRLTGLPCPGCGLTRAFCAISHGQFLSAFKLNPFAFAFYAAALTVLFWPLLRRAFPRTMARANVSRILSIAVPTLVFGMIVYGIARIAALLS